jgi:hypothetical protein
MGDPPVSEQRASTPAGETGGPPPTTTTTGIVFVHGIGTQPPRETFLNWSEPIVRMLSALRREADAAAGGGPLEGEDPVSRAGADGDRVWARIEIPAAAGRARDTWLVTESYWAGEVRAPSLVATLGYLRRHLPAIIRGVTDGYGQREKRRVDRLQTMVAAAGTGDAMAARDAALVAELSQAQSRRWAWIDWLDQVWQFRVVRWLLASAGILLTTAALAIYAPLRALPIKAIRDQAELAALNTWLVDWFGDIPVLLDDRVQGAMIRSRLETSIRWLVDNGCDSVVIVAHSGGAMVSYATLLRLRGSNLPVAKLVTLGEGLRLAWRILEVDGPLPAGHPLVGDLGAAQPDLRWVDFWASYDPAPAGPLAPVDGCPMTVSPAPDPPGGSPIKVESRPVTNLMNMALDHGGYWDNDEGFLVALLRHLDDPHGSGAGSRFYGSELARAARIERRRRRVGILLGWRWLSFAAGALGVVLTSTAPGGLTDVGNAVAWAWSLVPGSEWLSGPIAAVGTIVGVALELVRLGGLNDWLGAHGAALLGALVPVVGAVLIYRRGTQTWDRADERERAKIRTGVMGRAGEAWARSEACLLVGGFAALVLATLVAPRADDATAWVVVIATLVVAALLGIAIRFLQPPDRLP